MGSTEQQGIHSLTGDYLAAEAIAKRVAEKAGAYYVPVIPFGCSEYFRCFPGTISLRPSTVEAVITDVVESLTEHGITKIFFINGHAGNTPTIEEVARKLRREKGIVCFSIDLWQGLTPEAKKEIYGEGPDSSGHGGDRRLGIDGLQAVRASGRGVRFVWHRHGGGGDALYCGDDHPQPCPRAPCGQCKRAGGDGESGRGDHTGGP